MAHTPVDHKQLHQFCVTCLNRQGVSPADANTIADVLVTTDAWGVYTHGTKLLPAYIRRLQGGGLRAQGRPSIASEGPAWAIVDGDSAMGQVASAFAMICKTASEISAVVVVDVF